MLFITLYYALSIYLNPSYLHIFFSVSFFKKTYPLSFLRVREHILNTKHNCCRPHSDKHNANQIMLNKVMSCNLSLNLDILEMVSVSLAV